MSVQSGGVLFIVLLGIKSLLYSGLQRCMNFKYSELAAVEPAERGRSCLRRLWSRGKILA